MNRKHPAIFVAWSIAVLLVTGFFVVAFTMGDCVDEGACTASKNHAMRVTLGIGFVVYWAVAIALFRRWSR